MSQPIDPTQFSGGAGEPSPGAPEVPNSAGYMEAVRSIWTDKTKSYQQKLAATQALGPAPAPTPTAPPVIVTSPRTQLEQDRAAGRISYQQYLQAAATPNAYVNPNTPKPAAAPAATPVAPPPQGPAASVQGVFADQGAAGATPPPFQYTGGSGAAGGIIPAHAVSKVSPETRSLYEKAYQEKMAAANQGEEAETGAAQNEAASALNMSKVYDAQAEAAQEAEDKRTKAYNEQWADYQKVRKEADKGTIQPKQVGMMGAIATALGALGAGLAHTPNFAMEAINKRINDDIEAQRANITGKRESARGALEGLGQMRARFGDERIAESAYRALELEKAKATGDVMVAQAKSPMLAAKWAGVRANIDAEQAPEHGNLEAWLQPQQVGGVGSKEDEFARNLYKSKFGQPGNTVEAAQQEAAKLFHHGQGGAAPLISGMPKGGGGAMSPRLARRMADLDAADQASARLQKLLTTPGGSLSLGDRERAKADASVVRRIDPSFPEDPLTVFSASGARAERVSETRRHIANERQGITKYGGGSEGEPEGNPDDYITPEGK